MSFASPLFLWFFMPVTLVAYWATPRRLRNGVVAVASLVFYAWGAGPYVALLVSAILVNFAAGIAIDSARISARGRRTVLVGAVAWDLGLLAVWKYAGFASRQIDALSSVLGLGHGPIVDLALPIGISFFTFHHISYVVDVYRRSRPAQRGLVGFVTYIAMFPQLVAGPVVRYHEISAQLADTARDRYADLAAGFPRFALGLAKKVIVADTVAPIADAAFAVPGGEIGAATAWVGALTYTVQIYFDFSGYSDMAVGLGTMFGFRLPENFARPYSAYSVTDFWRRWHISLSRWFRDYVYIPLGGNRRGTAVTYRNLLVIFVLCGFWHGAGWTFLCWGLYHGGLLVAERALGWDRPPGGVPALVLRRAATFLLVVAGWVLFRSADLSQAAGMLGAMAGARGGGLDEFVLFSLDHRRTVVLALAMTVVLLPGSQSLGRLLERGRDGAARWAVTAARAAVTFVAAPYAGVLVAAGTFSPFLYYQF
ncbi:alginate O-acetyltransferase [Sphaerisporangium siamense]|uniref:Alginate O-acetyltransferase complex protein AlgI n=1 Tax=Sphaerisporangium siamense TaxID=795645 RepID=A0A7W7DEQ9_9ACTN|nr:MBOAT family protein [Sphaerisporangium siamense]MBB4705447.1 alginate O-acetyltransferase complex protein AlgI [Sphaerisporangium siamense]GII86401.1 alginate O-acetyltransferase [Sphaerisporangium siamense]